MSVLVGGSRLLVRTCAMDSHSQMSLDNNGGKEVNSPMIRPMHSSTLRPLDTITFLKAF